VGISIWTKKIDAHAKIKEAITVYLIMFLLFFPYVAIHYSLYGHLLPPSRTSLFLSGQGHLSFYASMVAGLFTNWYYDIDFKGIFLNYGTYVRMIFIVLLTLAIYGIYRFRLLSGTGIALFFACLSQILFILYTGRREAGMWVLAGIISWMISVDIIYLTAKKILKEERRVRTVVYFSIAVIIPFLFTHNTGAQPLLPAELYYHRHYESSQAAYRAIDENADRIVLLRLPGAEPLMHPMAFWMGNKIYHKEPGFGFYPEYNIITFKNMNIESHENPEERIFEHFRPFLVPRPGNEEVVVVKDRNSFSRIFLDSRSAIISRTAVIPYAPHDYFLIRYPMLSTYNTKSKHIEIKLTFSKRSVDIEKIRYGKSEITHWKSSDGTISFISDDLSSENPLTITPRNPALRVEFIEVRFPEGSPRILGNADRIPDKKIDIVAEKPCRYLISLSTDGSKIAGTLDAGKSLSFSPMFAEPGAITYSSFEIMLDKRKRQTIPLDAVSGQARPLVIGKFGN
jgi:hypothetical protein